MSFRLFSSDLTEGGVLPLEQVFNSMGFTGGNTSPQLAWENAPEGTKSFVVTVYDPDAPTGSGWWHWIVADIPASATELDKGAGSGKASLPPGAFQTRNDFGFAGFGGAAPPPGVLHHYVFTVHALKVDKIGIDEQVSGAMVGFMIYMHGLGKATLTVTYTSNS
jgi:Raf kinase inhibitor-like YbhB/YbcL family protein